METKEAIDNEKAERLTLIECLYYPDGSVKGRVIFDFVEDESRIMSIVSILESIGMRPILE